MKCLLINTIKVPLLKRFDDWMAVTGDPSGPLGAVGVEERRKNDVMKYMITARNINP